HDARTRRDARDDAGPDRTAALGGAARARRHRRRPADRSRCVAMILIGAACALVSVVGLLLASRRDTVVQRRLALLAPSLRRGPRWRPVADRDLRQAGFRGTQSELMAAKLLGLALGAVVGGMAGGIVGAGGLAAAGLAYGGFVSPSIAVERTARARRREAERAVGPLLERLEALVASGRPVETAF